MSTSRSSPPRSPRKTSRRRFLEVLALASTLAPALPAAAAGATKTARSKASASAPAQSKARSAEVNKEIENQKKFVARALETLRKHPLPTGSEPAFVFVPLEPGQGAAERGAPHWSQAGGSGPKR